jgi:excisionase family DNA binding protein
MKLTIREAAVMLGVPEKKLYRWVDDGDIPFVTIQHRPLFHRLELLEWAMENDIPASVDLYEVPTEAPLSTALECGGGHVMAGAGLAQIAGDLPVEPAERDLIAAVVSARADEMFQPRNGIAIPRPRSPLICPDLPCLVQLWWPREQALTIDSAQVKAVFVILTPTLLDHLQLLARLALLLRDAAVASAVKTASSLAAVLAETRRVEQSLGPARTRSAKR